MAVAGLRPRIALLLVVAVTLVGLGSASWAVPSEDDLEDARERAENLEDEVAGAREELSRVEAELDELEKELATVREELDAALAVHEEAEAAAEEASRRAREVEEELTAASDELSDNTRKLGELARDTYMYGSPTTSPGMTTFELLGNESDELGDRLHYLTRGVDVRGTVVERSEALRTRVEVLTERAQEEERELRAREAEAEEKRDEAARLHARVAELVSEQSEKLDRSVALVETLESDQQDAEQRVEELEEQVEQERAEAERREREARERRARQAAAASSSSSGSSGSSSSSSGGSSGSSSSSSGGVSVRPGPNGNLRRVGGITVHASIASQLAQLLEHARRDGIRLGGHGYRSPEVTARLRMTNGCPDVHSSPASSCRVPTARPGSSMHEKGLAVDFTYRGQTICFPRRSSQCSGNAAFDWLQRHAGSYGLKNLPKEAWHWSTNGH